MAKNGYKTLNLPAALVDELGVWKMAFEAAYGKPDTYGEMIKGMLDSIKDTKPEVVDEIGIIINKHPELLAKLGVYRELLEENVI